MKTVAQTLQAIRAHPDSIADFLAENPEAISYGKRMRQAIAGKKIPLHGTPYEIAERAFNYERGPDKIGLTMESIFNETRKRNAEKS